MLIAPIASEALYATLRYPFRLLHSANEKINSEALALALLIPSLPESSRGRMQRLWRLTVPGYNPPLGQLMFCRHSSPWRSTSSVLAAAALGLRAPSTRLVLPGRRYGQKVPDKYLLTDAATLPFSFSGTYWKPSAHHLCLSTRDASHRTHMHEYKSLSTRPCSSIASALPAGGIPAPSMSSEPQVDYRLPTTVRPTHYDLTIRTDLEKSRFDGFVKVHLDILKDTSQLVFNTAELELSNPVLYSEALHMEQTPSTLSFDTIMERGFLSFTTPLPADSKAQLSLSFTGQLTGAMMGYYKSVGGEDGKDVYALTQFEPTIARKAFPCWDEPSLKATFAVTLISRADTVNLSNMSVASESIYEPGTTPETNIVLSWLSTKLSTLGSENADKWIITGFDTSPPAMAWANGHFKYLESSYVSPLSGKTRPLRIYATAEIIHQAQFALDLKRQILPIYEKVFDIEYPLPKLDTLVAHDYDAGAMENWGLITGRTSTLLLDPKSSDLPTKKHVAETQCHEVAHMWFGDITTMAWWDNLFRDVGGRGHDSWIFPEWKLNSAFVSGRFAYALNVDAKISSHPIEVECPDANMVNQIFDGLSYAKAAAVLRMLASFVGEEGFLKGVSVYLKKHLFKNSVTKDLWNGHDIPKMMDNWVKTTGYPVLTVTEAENGIHVRQDRFLDSGPANATDNQTIWTIPLSILTVTAKGDVIVNRELVLDQRSMFIPLDVTKPFKLNAGTVSFCRVFYPPERLVKIGREAAQSPSPFSIEDRMGIVDDALALSKAGFSKVSSALSLIDVLRNEQEYLVWDSISKNLAQMRNVWWEHDDIADFIDGFRRELFTPIVQRLGYVASQEDDADTQELRTLAIEAASFAGEKSVVKELTDRFAYYLKTGDDSRIPAELEQAIYNAAVLHGGREEWEAVKHIAAKPKTPSSGVAAMLAMCATEDLDLAEETFQYTMTDARDQDLMYFFRGLAMNKKTRRLLVVNFKKNYDAFDKRLEGNYSMQFLVSIAISPLSSDKDYEETVEFFKTKDTSKYDMVLKQSLDSIASRSAWIKRSTNDVQEWFRSRTSLSKV
ncbi:uncharacterized protein FIBRA_06062 [Fibroporia radiculosa]|uniref:Aminopeptidase n=1 Tax=Fibroporia radiculosa TaxID=599839 RepID=J4IB23_9APHY|nr:uncharacterized protein FIBRA_06062 [Fibroporia radiculosa]CCM03911.1 predicted protein [Fibroporia radiculosa]